MPRSNARSRAGLRSVTVAAGALCVLLVASGGLGGCGDDGRATGAGSVPRLEDRSGEPEIRRLRVGALPVTDLKQLYVADAKGFFREEGLEVQVENFEGGATIIPGVESGSLDLGWSNSVSVLQARARGLDMRFFAGGLYQGPDHWTSAVMVRRDSPVRTLEQLRGRTVALNTLGNINELVMRASMDREGVPPDAYELLEVPFPDQAAALEAARIDAIVPTEPFTTVAEQGGARVVHARPFSVLGPDPFVAAFFATDDWLREHPNTAAAFRRAVNRATAYWNAHPRQRAAIIARYTKVPAAAAERIVFGEPRTEVSAADVQRQIELAHRYGLIPRTFDAGDVLTG
jgi:NitT/TauT family transport system substrate-binding protein